MKHSIRLAIMALGSLLSISCTSFETKILSDPPGARIEVDYIYVGDAPVTVKWRGWTASKTFTESHTVSALPIHKGQRTQEKYLLAGLTVPETILFDMKVTPVP